MWRQLIVLIYRWKHALLATVISDIHREPIYFVVSRLRRRRSIKFSWEVNGMMVGKSVARQMNRAKRLATRYSSECASLSFQSNTLSFPSVLSVSSHSFIIPRISSYPLVDSRVRIMWKNVWWVCVYRKVESTGNTGVICLLPLRALIEMHSQHGTARVELNCRMCVLLLLLYNRMARLEYLAWPYSPRSITKPLIAYPYKRRFSMATVAFGHAINF